MMIEQLDIDRENNEAQAKFHSIWKLDQNGSRLKCKTKFF